MSSAQSNRRETSLGETRQELSDACCTTRPKKNHLLAALPDADGAETAVVGNEGIVGIALFMGGESTSNSAVAQGADDDSIDSTAALDHPMKIL